MASLKKLKTLDHADKSLVFGYITHMEEESNISSIPLVIVYKILAYFYIYEYFSECGDDLQITDDKTTVTKAYKEHHRFNHRWWNNAYGHLWFNSNGNEIVKWKFEIKGNGIVMNGLRDKVFFVLTPYGNRLNDDATNQSDAPNYGFSNEGGRIYYSRDGNCDIGDAGYGADIGDKITIQLNTITGNGNIRCKVNNDEYVTVYDEIEQNDNLKYKLAVSIALLVI